jgi:heme oxygenase
MDAWLNCVYGVDCETHRQALSEIQKLRDEVNDLHKRLDKIHAFVLEQAS